MKGHELLIIVFLSIQYNCQTKDNSFLSHFFWIFSLSLALNPNAPGLLEEELERWRAVIENNGFITPFQQIFD